MALQNQPPPRKRIPRSGQHYRHAKDAQRRGDDTRDVMALMIPPRGARGQTKTPRPLLYYGRARPFS